MTYQQEILARAMNHIDDELILAAHGPRKKMRRAIPVIIALCLVAALAVAFPYLREIIDTNSDLLASEDESLVEGNPGYKPEKDDDNEVGLPVSLGSTTATLLDVTETTATFEVVKTDNVPVYAILYGLRDDALASTEPNFTDNGVVIRPNTLRLYVDGAETPVYEFPSAPGTYRITVDFTSIRNGTYPMQERMGLYAYIGVENAPCAVLFSLAVPEESDTAELSTAETQSP